jgi:hypothetical protein
VSRTVSGATGVSLPRSLEELGLKLEPKESLSDFVIVDSIERRTEMIKKTPSNKHGEDVRLTRGARTGES